MAEFSHISPIPSSVARSDPTHGEYLVDESAFLTAAMFEMTRRASEIDQCETRYGLLAACGAFVDEAQIDTDTSAFLHPDIPNGSPNSAYCTEDPVNPVGDSRSGLSSECNTSMPADENPLNIHPFSVYPAVSVEQRHTWNEVTRTEAVVPIRPTWTDQGSWADTKTALSGEQIVRTEMPVHRPSCEIPAHEHTVAVFSEAHTPGGYTDPLSMSATSAPRCVSPQSKNLVDDSIKKVKGERGRNKSRQTRKKSLKFWENIFYTVCHTTQRHKTGRADLASLATDQEGSANIDGLAALARRYKEHIHKWGSENLQILVGPAAAKGTKYQTRVGREKHCSRTMYAWYEHTLVEARQRHPSIFPKYATRNISELLASAEAAPIAKLISWKSLETFFRRRAEENPVQTMENMTIRYCSGNPWGHLNVDQKGE